MACVDFPGLRPKGFGQDGRAGVGGGDETDCAGVGPFGREVFLPGVQ